MLFGKRKSYKQQAAEEKEKQRMLDEIHQWPHVKKTFVVCEIFRIINWLIAIVIFVTLGLSFLSVDIDFVNLEDVFADLLEAIGGPITLIAFVVVKLLAGALKKKYNQKLEVLEEAGLQEIQKAKDEGTYVEGPKMPLGYRILRTIITIISCVVVFGVLIILGIQLLS